MHFEPPVREGEVGRVHGYVHTAWFYKVLIRCRMTQIRSCLFSLNGIDMRLLLAFFCLVISLYSCGCSAATVPNKSISKDSEFVPAGSSAVDSTFEGSASTRVKSQDSARSTAESKKITQEMLFSSVDQTLLSQMKCEPLRDSLLQAATRNFGKITSSVQVYIGTGPQNNEDWWVILIECPVDDLFDKGYRAFLTNSPSIDDALLANGEIGTWIQILVKADGYTQQFYNESIAHIDTISTDYPFENIAWDEEHLAKAQAALAKADDYMRN